VRPDVRNDGGLGSTMWLSHQSKLGLRIPTGIAPGRSTAIILPNCWRNVLLAIGVCSGAATAAPNTEPTPAASAGSLSAGGPSSEATAERGAQNLDLPTALRLAEARAPELLGPQAELRGVTAFRAAADRTLHRPPRVEVSVGPRHVPGGGRLGVDATVGVFQEFSTAHYGAELDRYATSAKLRAETALEAARRDARVRASIAWLDALEARELLGIRKRAVAGAREILRIAEARLAAGRSSPGEAALAQSLVGSAEAAVLSAEGSITTADATLRHVCGIELHRRLSITGALEIPPEKIDEETIRGRVREAAPDLVAARAHARALEQSAKLGQTQSRPHLELGPSVSREGTGEWVFLGHLRLPLPGIDPAAADNAERQLTAQAARASVAITEQAILRDVEIALHEREHALRVRDLLRTGSILPAERAVHEAELQYEAGRADLVGVITARRELYDALEKWTRAAIDVRRSEATLERYVAATSGAKGPLPAGTR
jgi:outer membrane protein, heavy metal efflux system